MKDPKSTSFVVSTSVAVGIAVTRWDGGGGRGWGVGWGWEGSRGDTLKKNIKKNQPQTEPKNTEAPSVDTEKQKGKSFLPIKAERSPTRMKAGYAHALARERVQMSRDRHCYTGAQRTAE